MPLFRVATREWRTFYVVFQKSQFKRPWHFFCWNGYEHIWVFYPHYLGPPGLLTPKHSLKVEPLATYQDVAYWPFDPDEAAEEIKKEDSIRDIVKISLPIHSNLSYNIRGFINCVTIVKFILGIRKWFIMTPQQLRRHLLRIGGRSIKKNG